MLSDIKAAVFDLDGTLIDSMGVWERVDRSFLSKHGFPQDEYYIEQLRNKNYREAVEFTLDYLKVDLTPEELMAEWDEMAIWEYGHSIPLKEGAHELLAYCKSKNMPIILATVSNPGLYETVLKRHDIYDYFTGFTSEEAADKGKSDPFIYLEAASIAGVTPGECIVFEDILKGIQSASSAGFVTCAVEDASQWKDRDQIKAAADLYVRDLTEALSVLRT